MDASNLPTAPGFVPIHSFSHRLHPSTFPWLHLHQAKTKSWMPSLLRRVQASSASNYNRPNLNPGWESILHSAVQMCLQKNQRSILDKVVVGNIADAYNGILLDMDGVLWHGNDTIQGSMEAVKALREAGKRVIFVTNNAKYSRKDYALKFQKYGLDAKPEDIVTSGSALASYVKQKYDSKRAYVVGESGLVDELRLLGIETIKHEQRDVMNEDIFAALGKPQGLQLEQDVDLVALGWDLSFNFAKMSYASLYIQRGAKFVATNTDVADKSSNGYLLPGTGPILSAVEMSCNVQAEVVGKPNKRLIDQILFDYNLTPEKTIMVGDRLDTDILFANNGNIASALVFTGCTTMEEFAKLPETDPRQPGCIFHSLYDFVTSSS